jgi:hypothetical protein
MDRDASREADGVGFDERRLPPAAPYAVKQKIWHS